MTGIANEIGYGKPPRHTRCKKGQSGNPRGRPSGSKNLNTLLNETLNEPVVVMDEGRRRKITKREAIVTQLVNRSSAADLRALKILLDTIRDIEGQASRYLPKPPRSVRRTRRDRAAHGAFCER